jgi:hypothetical protein
MSVAEVNFPLLRYADEVRGAAVTYCAGRQTENDFVEALLEIEAAKLRPNGVTLAVSHTIDGWITVMMKQNGTGQLYAAFEFMPESQKFRRFSHLEEYPRNAQPRA